MMVVLGSFGHWMGSYRYIDTVYINCASYKPALKSAFVYEESYDAYLLCKPGYMSMKEDKKWQFLKEQVLQLPHHSKQI